MNSGEQSSELMSMSNPDSLVIAPRNRVFRAVLWARNGVKQFRKKTRRFPWIPLIILLGLLVIPALFADLLTHHNPLRGDLSKRLLPGVWDSKGSWEFPLGTDKQGRDILTRIIFGARVSLTVCVSAIGIGLFMGTTLGLLAGYFGRRVDQVISFLVDTTLSLPFLLLALVVVAAVGPSFMTVVLLISATLWAHFTRIVRGEALTIRESDYVARAKVAGASGWRIIMRHVLPNVANSLVVVASLQVGVVILREAALSFIGAGIPRPMASWGVMIADGRDQIMTAPWLSIIPGVAILLVVLSINLLGDWLRDFLDPRMRQKA
jgi:peptide/nickel transport system permease protein